MILLMTFYFLAFNKNEINFSTVDSIGGGNYFTIKFFPFHIIGTTWGGKYKVLDVSLEKKVGLEQLKIKEQTYTAYLKEQTILVLSQNGEIIGSYSLAGSNRSIISSYIDDINNDGDDKILLVIGEKRAEFGDTLVMLEFDGKKLKEIYNQSFEVLNPWKVQTCDVDGDGQKEISLGVYKKSEFHPVMAKRPFIYEWQDRQLIPKWRGSRLSRPFTDYIFFDMNESGSDELLAIEILENGNKILHAYKWKGFGFEGVGESLPFKEIKKIQILEKGNTSTPSVLIKERDKVKWYLFSLEEEKIKVSIETKEER